MRTALFALALFLPAAAAAQAQAPVGAASADQGNRWITLGTRGGPVASATRGQPGNALVDGGHVYLVDAGDGTVEQLAKAGIPALRVDAVFISHLHFDHTAGLAGLLGLRWQTNAGNVLRIYGPPGTRALVDGLLASMVPATSAGYGVPGAPEADPRQQVTVTELRDRGSAAIDRMTVTARKNTHYSFVPGSAKDRAYESLSLRFDLPGRSIVYTGDTGPSAQVEDLARGADLLVAEMMDVDYTIAGVRHLSPGLDPRVLAATERHLHEHHLRPADVGELAQRAGVKGVVVTHFVGREPSEPGHFDYLREIARAYAGPVAIANDLDAF